MPLSESLVQKRQQDVLATQRTKPVQLGSVAVTGGDLDSEYLQQLVAPVLGDTPVSFGQLHSSLEKVEQTLIYTGLFRDVKIKLDLDESKKSSEGSPVPVQAAVTLTDLPLFKYSSYSKSTDYDVAGGVRYLHPNFTQKADTLLVDINVNCDPFSKTLNRKSWDITYLHPLPNTISSRVIVNPSVATIDATQWAGHKQYAVGAFLGHQSTKICQKLQGLSILTAGFSGTLRQVTDISNSASDIIRTNAGGDMKLGATINYNLDTRQFIGKFATSGFLVDVTNEFAGHNSVDHHSFQQNSSGQQHIELQPFNKASLKFEGATSFLWDNLTASCQLEAGAIKSFVEDGAEKLHISDKFFLGGLNSLKGFQLNSVGAKSGNDHVGGSSAFKLGLSLFSRVPNTNKNSPLRLYGFFNAGDVQSSNSCEDTVAAITSGEVITKAAAATGFGLAYKADNAMLDLSYNVPLTSRAQDEAKPGLSLAVILNFK